jgi:signal transduction histidine kinase
VGTPSLGLGFWVPGRGWTCPDGRPLAAPAPDSGQVLTKIDREGRPMAAVVHSEQLEESPELIRAVVTTSMLIYENAALEAELRSAIRELRSSRSRVVKAGDLERRRIERDLHDGAQQRLISLGIKLKATSEAADGDAVLQRRIAGLCTEVDRALGEIRGLAHGIFPALLADLGLIPALRAAARNSPLSVRVAPVLSRRRYPPDLEAAVYFCCLEALQNAGKYAGPQARVSVSLVEAGPNLRFNVRDDGCGFDPATVSQGDGMVGMRDRLGAIGGALRVTSSPGAGTEISGTVPFGVPSTGPGLS